MRRKLLQKVGVGGDVIAVPRQRQFFIDAGRAGLVGLNIYEISADGPEPLRRGANTQDGVEPDGVEPPVMIAISNFFPWLTASWTMLSSTVQS